MHPSRSMNSTPAVGRGNKTHNLPRMAETELTPEQEAIAFSEQARFAVRASAGAGKTRVLVERYVWHVVERGISPDQILTITFTRKAAAEMKERIVKRLSDLGLDEAAQLAQVGPIQTIHGFCERLLRANALAAGIDPKFEVIADSPLGREIADDALRQALADLAETSIPVRDLLLQRAGSRSQFDPYLGLLKKPIQEAVEKLRSSGLRPSDLTAHYSDPAAYWSLVRRCLEVDLPEIGPTANPGEWYQAMDAALRERGSKRPRWMRTASPETEEAAARESVAVGQLILATWELVESEMGLRQAFDFNELESRAVRLVQSNPGACERIRRSYVVALIDEGQDVNPNQHRLIQSLGLEAEMMVGDPQQAIYGFRQADRELFVQRIAAEETCLLSKNHRSEPGILRFVDRYFGRIWGEHYMPMMQPESRPCEPFAEDPTDFEGVEFWDVSAAKDDETGALLAALLDEQEFSPSEIAVLVRKSQQARRLCARLDAEEIPYRVVGGVDNFYTRMEIRDLANALQAIVDPYDDFALLAMLRSPLVGLPLDDVVLLGRRKPVAETLELVCASAEIEPYHPTTQEAEQAIARLREWFAPLHPFADRLPAWELLSIVIDQTEYFERLALRPNGFQLIANVRKLLELATKEPKLDARHFAEQVRTIQRLDYKEGTAPTIDEKAEAVTVLTIHKAKGLEWPCVVLPGLLDKPWKDKALVRTETKHGVVAAALAPQKSMVFSKLQHEAEEREAEEEKRVLYVAMTRAMRRLCICLSETAEASTSARTIAQHFPYRETPPPGVRVRRVGVPSRLP